MNVRAKREEEDRIKTIDYNCYLDAFHTLNKPIYNIQHDKTKTQSTSRPLTANNLGSRQRNPINSKTDYIEDLIKRKTLLNIEYEALKGQPKFQSFLLGISSEAKVTEKILSPLPSPKWKEENSGFKEYNSAKIFNTLGIRRNRSAMRTKQHSNPEQYIKSPLFDRQYQQLNQFPARQSSLLKLKTQKDHQKQMKQPKNVHSEGHLNVRLLISWVKDPKKIKRSHKNVSGNDPSPKRENILEKIVQGVKMTIYH